MKVFKGREKNQPNIQVNMEELVEQIADYAEFMEPVEEELSEEELDRVAAAKACSPYERFLEHMKKDESV